MHATTNHLPIQLITWNKVYSLCRTLSLRIIDAGFRPDMIIAIARGGYVPARILCDLLDISQLTDIRIVHYGPGAQKKTAKLTAPLKADVHNKNVLIVDDITDTGESLEIAQNHINTIGTGHIRTAVLLHKINSPIQPDFFAGKIIKWRWIIYPWAVHEDLTAFLARMDHIPDTPEEAKKRFERDYHVRLPLKILTDIYRLRNLP